MGQREVIVFLGMLCTATSAAAQGELPPLPARALAVTPSAVYAESRSQQLDALRRWTHDYTAWRAWYLDWRSRPEPGLWSTRARRPQPVPPVWLSDMCRSTLVDAGPLADACRAYDDWSEGDGATGVFTQRLLQARAKREAPDKTFWWERIHVDGLWPMTQTGSSAYGVVGMHSTMHLTDRLQVFLTPGMILMRVPSVQGGMAWSAATDWGFSCRLFDFRMPAMNRRSSVHFNIVRVWVLGQHAIQSPGEMYLAGFSITFKKR